METANGPLSTHANEAGHKASAVRQIATNLVEIFTPPRQFTDQTIESAYIGDHGRRFAGSRLAASILACLTWSVFLGWDLYNGANNEAFRHVLPQILLLRFAGTAVLGALVYLCSRIRRDSLAQLSILCGVLAAGTLLVGQVAFSPPTHAFTHYFSGLYLVEFFQFGFFNLKAKATLATSCILVATVFFMQAVFHPLAPENFVYGMFFLVIVILTGLAVNVHAERHCRDRFLAELAMRDANERLALANTDLENKQQILEETQKARAATTEALLAIQARQREEAERQNQAKSMFLATATHDLRQPMHALNLFLHAGQEAFQRGNFPEVQRLIAQASDAANVMARLFNSILELSRLEAGGVVPEYHQLELTSILKDVIDQVGELARSQGVTVRLRTPSIAVHVISDAHWLHRVLTNLVANAIKYHADRLATPPTVLVGIVRLNTRVRVDIVDNGIGIPPQLLRDIFRPFYQVSNDERSRDNGLGLGLSIVNAAISILKEHRIEVRSRLGIGSRFSIDLPRPSLDGIERQLNQPPGETADEIQIQNRFVLLVEDDPLARASMIALLEQWGMLVEGASDLGELDGMLIEIERPPDLVILDYRLPGQCTYRDALTLIGRRTGASLPYLVVTGESVPPSHPEVTCGRLLMKPVNPWLLRNAIARAMQQQ
ncbi:ATP-binding protein [Cupriavidus sp. CuC1]|uniref:hybrid sensor histidine kinase/response regulator n=1 Tax=Cupriavidus sp. CuC1 TaxID=3373131 RepID=UPI0037CFA9C6